MSKIEFCTDSDDRKIIIDEINCPECGHEIKQELDLTDYDFWVYEDGLVEKCYIYCPECRNEIELDVEGETWLEFRIKKLTLIKKV